MDTESVMIVTLIFYKSISLLIGASFAYMGYRLFLAGIWGHAGDMKIEFKDNKLLLKKAAPGTFFVVLGTIVILFTLFKGLEYAVQDRDELGQPGESAPTLPLNPPK